MTELVQAGEGHFGVIPPQTQRDSASTFAQGLGGVLAAAPVGLRECSYFMDRERQQNSIFCLGGREESGSAFMDAVWSSCIIWKLYLVIRQVTELI